MLLVVHAPDLIQLECNSGNLKVLIISLPSHFINRFIFYLSWPVLFNASGHLVRQYHKFHPYKTWNRSVQVDRNAFPMHHDPLVRKDQNCAVPRPSAFSEVRKNHGNLPYQRKLREVSVQASNKSHFAGGQNHERLIFPTSTNLLYIVGQSHPICTCDLQCKQICLMKFLEIRGK